MRSSAKGALQSGSTSFATPIYVGATLGVGTAAVVWAVITAHFGLANCFWL